MGLIRVFLLASFFLASPSLVFAQEVGKQFEINELLKEETSKDPNFANFKVNASFLDGYVTLRGYVDNLWQKHRLIEIAHSVNGAKGVIDQLQIANISISSEDLAKQMALNIYRDEVADIYELKIETDDYGRARISGKVDSLQEKNAAEDAGQRVKGVVFVQNDVSVEPESERTDSEAQKDLEFALYEDVLVDERRLQAQVESSEAVLEGNVGSETEAMVVEEISKSIPGVKRVRGTELTVVPRFDRTLVFKIDPLDANYTDEDLARLVDQANYYDTRVFSYNIEVDAKDGVVELSGAVQNEQAKKAALENAKNTLGVKEVRDNIRLEDFPDPGSLAE